MTTLKMPDLDDKLAWQRFVMQKNYELSLDPDVDVRSKALERLAKTSIVGLYETKVVVNISTLPTEALQGKLESLVERINARANEKGLNV
jgi:hypothetical protein